MIICTLTKLLKLCSTRTVVYVKFRACFSYFIEFLKLCIDIKHIYDAVSCLEHKKVITVIFATRYYSFFLKKITPLKTFCEKDLWQTERNNTQNQKHDKVQFYQYFNANNYMRFILRMVLRDRNFVSLNSLLCLDAF